MKGKRDQSRFDEVKALHGEFHKWESEGLMDLYYFDETGFSLTPCVPYAWQLKGKTTLEIPCTRSQRLNVLGFINRSNDNFFQMVTGSVSSEVVIDCFNQFSLQHEAKCGKIVKPCIVILDNASMHRSKLFKAQLDSWAARGVFIHYLPPYSPELNLIEMVWRKIKYSWLPLNAYKSFDVLKSELSIVLSEVGRKYRITFS